jgi:hypothetical protein
MGGGGTYGAFVDCVGDGGVFVGGGDEVELDLLDTSTSLPDCCFDKCSTTVWHDLARLGAVERNGICVPSFVTLSVIAAMRSGETPGYASSSSRSAPEAILSLIGGEESFRTGDAPRTRGSEES